MNVLRLRINAHRAIIDSARIRGRKPQEEGAPTRPRTPCKLNSSHENRGARLRDACAKLVWDFQVVPNIICKSVNLSKWFCTRCWERVGQWKKWSLRTAHFLPDLFSNGYFMHGWGHKRQISEVRLVRKKILYNFLKFCSATPWPVMSQQMLTRRKNMRLESGNNQSKWTPGMPQSLHSFAWWLNLPGAWFYADVDGNFYEMQPIFLALLHMPRVATLRSVYL